MGAHGPQGELVGVEVGHPPIPSAKTPAISSPVVPPSACPISKVRVDSAPNSSAVLRPLPSRETPSSATCDFG